MNYYSVYKNIGAVPMNADYINWFPLNSKEIKNVILVVEVDDDDKERVGEKAFFKTEEKAGTIDNAYAREKRAATFILKEATTSINKLLQQEINKIKSRH